MSSHLATRSQIAQTAKKGRRIWQSPLLPLVAAVAGTLSLIYAWKLQNYDVAAAADTRGLLMRSQLVVNLWEAKRDQWVIALNQELIKPKPDRQFLSMAAAEANKATLMWQGYLKVRTTKAQSERQNIFAERDNLIAGIDKLLERSDPNALMQVLDANVRTFKAYKSLDALDQQYFQVVDQTDGEIQRATWWMSTFYAAGTALMLLSTIISSVQLAQALRPLDRMHQAT